MRTSTISLIAMRAVQLLGNGLRQSLPALLCLSVVMLLTMHPAIASTFSASSGPFATFGGFIDQIGTFLTGPVAKFAGAICIIGGTYTFIRGGEINQGMHIFGGVAIGIGALIVLMPLLDRITSGATI